MSGIRTTPTAPAADSIASFPLRLIGGLAAFMMANNPNAMNVKEKG